MNITKPIHSARRNLNMNSRTRFCTVFENNTASENPGAFNRFIRTILMVAAVVLFNLPISAQAQPLHPDSTYLIIRCDDIGMCHAVNAAAEQLFKQDFPLSVSVMFACPWYQEAVDMLQQYPHVSVGVHLTLNAEWKNYRWGPVLGREAVPSLVDSNGYFLPSRATFFANEPDINEIERELRAQIDRAMNSGITIDYLDHHMGTAVQTRELRELVEALAKEYGLTISTYHGERYSNLTYNAPLGTKTDSLVQHIRQLPPGLHLQVCHIGLDSEELRGMEDLNLFGLQQMSAHRQNELDALLSIRFHNVLHDHNIRLLSYRQLVQRLGLDSMRRPQDVQY
ncbi:MAG: ChbG/HpnK family deacetylase [Caldithrix sp.]|nr:ChbG/HpnK family deacetylase [Caldithrix sp.]